MTPSRNICANCRRTVPVDAACLCAVCHGPVTRVGSKWRPPRKANDSGWARVAVGELLWDRAAVERAERRGVAAQTATAARAKVAHRKRLASRVAGETAQVPHI